ncbi:MAG: DUF4956 domain-containing protein [Bacteroidaceae bacterium]|nr:DUF4956 domain-containing protein [Bacteroidaceae bacterium]
MDTFFTSDFINMLIRLVICVFFSWFIIDRLYYAKSQRRDFYFTFMLISVAIFLLVFFMIFVLDDMKGKTGIGIGIGLFGIFSIMRYRTDSMPVREMTYLFVIVAMAVINALAVVISYQELLVTNAVMALLVWLCEINPLMKRTSTKLIQYDRIELVKPENRDVLLNDLRNRTGLDIVDVEVGGMDFLRDMAMLRITYNPTDKLHSSVESMTKLPKKDII